MSKFDLKSMNNQKDKLNYSNESSVNHGGSIKNNE